MQLWRAVGRIRVLSLISVSYGRDMPYWRNILEVAREERLEFMRERTTSAPAGEARAMVARRNADREFPAPSIDGLEVTEITILDISLGTPSR